MALFTISDTHLSTLESTNKSMEIFGRRWQDYMDKLKKNWTRLVTDNDTVVIPGDISWGLSLEEATQDLIFLDSLPGKKILGKGNHDFWWATMNKHKQHFEKHGITTIDFLFNNAHLCEDFVIAGTRGWFFEDSATGPLNKTDFDKMVAREELRLKASLDMATKLRGESDKEILVFMHFPPVYEDYVCENTISLLQKYGVKRVYYGHLHGNYIIEPTVLYNNIKFSIISSDYLDFIPKFIAKE